MGVLPITVLCDLQLPYKLPREKQTGQILSNSPSESLLSFLSTFKQSVSLLSKLIR